MTTWPGLSKAVDDVLAASFALIAEWDACAAKMQTTAPSSSPSTRHRWTKRAKCSTSSLAGKHTTSQSRPANTPNQAPTNSGAATPGITGKTAYTELFMSSIDAPERYSETAWGELWDSARRRRAD